jgi:hypothetical protein
MTLRARKRLVWSLCVVLALAIAGSGAGLALAPLPRLDTEGAGKPPPAPAAPAAKKPPISEYAVIYGRDLQRPLFDGEAEKGPPPKPPVTLVGTVVGSGSATAFLKTKAGGTQVVSVGQTVEGAEVTEITAQSATIKFAGTSFVLKVEKEGAAP